METPPSFTPPGKKSNTGLIVGLIIGGVLLCCALPIGLVVGGGFYAVKKVQGSLTCAIAFQQVRDSVTAYADANEGRLPSASKWMDEVRPYYEKEVKQMGAEKNPFGTMPVDGIWGCSDDSGNKTGIAFNSELSGKKLADIQDRASKIVIFEVPTPAMNKSEPYKPLSKSSSPKMMGQPRGWFRAPLEGEIEGSEISGSSGTGRANVKIKTE